MREVAFGPPGLRLRGSMEDGTMGYQIVAELERDKSEIQSDYFNTTTERTIVLCESKHGRDLFAELRKAALLRPETAHLGPGKDRYTCRVVLTNSIQISGICYNEGQGSPWHSELDMKYDGGHVFETQAEADAFVAAQPPIPQMHMSGGAVATFAWRIDRESVEHREKYSMGHGYYLKAGSRYSDGWVVRKIGA